MMISVSFLHGMDASANSGHLCQSTGLCGWDLVVDLRLKAEFNLESLFLTVCCAENSCYVDALQGFWCENFWL